MARPTDRRQPPSAPNRALRAPRRPADPASQQRVWAALMLAIISGRFRRRRSLVAVG